MRKDPGTGCFQNLGNDWLTVVPFSSWLVGWGGSDDLVTKRQGTLGTGGMLGCRGVMPPCHVIGHSHPGARDRHSCAKIT